MRIFLRFVINNPIATALVIVLAMLSGIYSILHLPVELFPNLQVPVVNIITHYPGAAPKDIELLISRPIENEMGNIPGVKRVASTSVQGISQVTVTFSWGTPVREARQLVQAKLAHLGSILPASVTPRLENIGTTLQEVCGYVIYGSGNPISLLNIVRHDLAGRLMSVEGVSSVEVLGGERRAFYVKIKPEALARHHLSVKDIVSILKNQNLIAVAGYLDRSGREYPIHGDARLRTLDDIRSLPVMKNNNQMVLLGSIARVSEGRVPKHYVIQGDGRPALAVIVRKQPRASTIRVAAGVEKKMTDLRQLLPPGAYLKKFYDQSEIIIEARNEILHDLFVGALLAVLVLYFFLGSVRPTLVVAVTIPITFLATVTIMHLLGLSLNVITMTALALATGMIVDDAIIVAENIYRHNRLQPDATEASIQGTMEIAGPDASGTFTTVAAFLPLIVASGLAALLLRPFGLTISTALVISLLLSLTLVPLIFSRSQAALSQPENFLGARLLAFLDRMLQASLKFSFQHKCLTLGLAFLFLGTGGLTTFLSTASVLPPIDEGAILIEYVMPPGTSLKESNRIGDALGRLAMAEADVSCVYRRTGSPESGYQIEGVNQGELMIKLKPKNQRGRSAEEIMASLKESYSNFRGVLFLYHQPTQEKIDESFSGLPALFGVTIYGPKVATLISLAAKVEDVLSKDPAVANVVNNTKVKASQIEVRVNYPKLAQCGMTTEDVLTTLRATRFGIEATRIIRQKEDVPVLVKMDGGNSFDFQQIKQLPVITAKGAIVPLRRIADINIRHVPAAITRLNGQREITLLAEVKGNIPSLVSRLRKKLQAIKLPKDYSIEFSGQYKILIKTALEMAFTIATAIALIYLIIAMQFGSWLQPFIIIFTIPLSLVGALIALFITGQGIDLSVGMGTVTLVGIAVNNAIVLINYANKSIAAGKSIQEALLKAAAVRLRPILLTSLTTIFVLIPTAIGTSVGSKIFQPFAITVIGGLVSGVFATLIIVPVFVAAVSHPMAKTHSITGKDV